MSNQGSLFATDKEKVQPARPARTVLVDDESPSSWKVLVLQANSNGSLVCRGFVVGDGGPPPRETVDEVLGRRGWVVESVKETDGTPCPFASIVYVVNDG